MPQSKLRKEWKKRITGYKESGQTQVKWCESNDISTHQFKYWMKRIKDTNDVEKRNNSWVPLVIEYRHRKKLGQRQLLLENLPLETIEYPLSEEEQVCSCCGGDLHEMSTMETCTINNCMNQWTFIIS